MNENEDLLNMGADGLIEGENLGENVAVTAPVTEGMFLDLLKRGNADIRKDRAQAIGESAELMYKREVEDIKVELTNMIRDRENYLDMSPDTALSLKVAADFNAKDFVGVDIKLSVAIRNLNIKYELAKKRYERLFGKGIA